MTMFVPACRPAKSLWNALASCVVFWLMCGSPAVAAVTLVQRGEAKARIILPAEATAAERAGAKILQEHLQQISGATLPITSEAKVEGPPTAAQPWILMGEGRLAGELGLTSEGLGPGGMVLYAGDNVLALLGTDRRTPSDPSGSRYAVTTFLEEKLGVRYLWPGELGKVVPRRDTIAIEDFEQRFSPPVLQRRIRSSGYSDRVQTGLDNLGFTQEAFLAGRKEAMATEAESGDWFAWQRLGGSLSLSSGHAFGSLWDTYGKEHPEWFAMQPNGERDQSKQPGRSRLCKSNPNLIAAIAKLKIEELDRKRQAGQPISASLSPNDGGSYYSFCQCPDCKALDHPQGRKVSLTDFTVSPRRSYEHVALTDRMVWFWNQLAEQITAAHPDASLVVDAYSAYSAPPVEAKLHESLVVRFVVLQYLNEERRQQGLRDWEQWSTAAKRIYFRPNLMLAGRRNGMPMVYVRKFAQDFRFLAERGMTGTDFDGCLHHWATQGLNYYVVSRLHWNPQADVEAIIDDYCQSGFGPAAAPVKQYFNRLEQLTNEVAEGQLRDTAPFTPEVLAELDNLLTGAERLAHDDKQVAARLALLRAGYRWTAQQAEAHALRAANEAGNRPDRETVKRVLDQRYELMRELFQQHPLALNVAAISWGEDGGWRQLGWRPQPAAAKE